MSNLLKIFGRDVIYNLKNDYGKRVDLIIHTTVWHNPETGESKLGKDLIKIKKAILLPTLLARELAGRQIVANLPSIEINTVTVILLVDRRDVPTNYEPTEDDYFVFDKKRWNVKTFEELEDNLTTMFVIQHTKGSITNAVYEPRIQTETIMFDEVAIGIKFP